MKADRRASEEGLHIKYVGRDAYWIDGLVLFVGSAIALVTAWWFIAAGISADAIIRTMVWPSASSPHTRLRYCYDCCICSVREVLALARVQA